MSDKPLVAVTGASSGIGAAIATAFSKEGYPLLLLARREDRLRELKLEPAICAAVDVTDREGVVGAIRAAESEHGPIGCLVNNAGVMLLGDVSVQDPKEWQTMLDVNVTGVLNTIHAVLGGMVERQTGTIVNVSSVAGRKTFPNHAVYCGTKFAVHAISENLREEVAGHNVRVITIAPGAVETELLSHTTSNEIKGGYEEWKTGMGGAIAAEDIARAVIFAYLQPQNVCVREIVIAATRQGP